NLKIHQIVNLERFDDLKRVDERGLVASRPGIYDDPYRDYVLRKKLEISAKAFHPFADKKRIAPDAVVICGIGNSSLQQASAGVLQHDYRSKLRQGLGI